MPTKYSLVVGGALNLREQPSAVISCVKCALKN